MAGCTVGAFGNDGSRTTSMEVLSLVPELLFFAFVAVIVVDSSIGLVASVRSAGRSRSGPLKEESSDSGVENLRGPPLVALLSVAGFAALLAPIVAPVLLQSLRVVLGAPLAVVVTAAVAAAATVVLAAAASLVVVATVLVAVETSAVMLARVLRKLSPTVTKM